MEFRQFSPSQLHIKLGQWPNCIRIKKFDLLKKLQNPESKSDEIYGKVLKYKVNFLLENKRRKLWNFWWKSEKFWSN